MPTAGDSRRPSQNILIRNCRMKEGHGGVVVGSQISGGARWVFAENCHMDSPDLWYAIRFKNNALRGGLLENFYYRDIDVGQVGRAAITCDFNYEEGANGPFIPQLKNVVVERLRVNKTRARAGFTGAAAGAGERHHAARLRVQWRDAAQHHQAHARGETRKGAGQRKARSGTLRTLDLTAGRPHTSRPMIFAPNLLALSLSLPHAGREGVA